MTSKASQAENNVATKRATITDVARLAKVSVGTVSHVLNGVTKVSDQLRGRVERATKELGYEQNMLAHALRRQRAPVVGLCVPQISSAYLSAMIETFEDIAAGRGYQLMQVMTRRDQEIELRRVRELLGHRVAGLILIPAADPRRTLEAIVEAGTPVVIVDRPVGGKIFDQVSFDNRGIMQQAVTRLIKLGHRRILFVVRSRRLVISRQRADGLRTAAAAAHPPASTEVLVFDDDRHAYTGRLAARLKGPDAATAIVVSNSNIAAATVRALRDLRIACPERVSLLAFEEPDWADLVTPRLSVIRQPIREITRQAWELLLRRMKGDAGPAEQLVLRAEIEFRASVGPAPVSRKRK
jgi:LacI family transcriptional regulator